MKINKLIAQEGCNLKGREPVIYLDIIESDKKMVFRLISDYEYICRHIGVKGTLKEVNYNSDGGNVWLTYKYKEIATYIIENLSNGKNIDVVIDNAFNLKQGKWDLNLIEKAEKMEVPIIKLEDGNNQIGYGINSRIVTKEEWEKDEDITVNNNGLIPIISVTGTNGKTSTVKLIHNILCRLGKVCGLSSTGAVYIGDKVIMRGDTTGFYSARMVLTNPTVEVAVLETARGGMIRKGLGYEKNKVSIITSLSEDHFDIDGICSIEDLLNVKKLIAQELLSDGKLIIASNYYLFKEFKNKNNVVLFNTYKDDYIKEHIKQGKEAWYIENEQIMFAKNNDEKVVMDIKEFPYTHYGKSGGNTKNLLVALSTLNTIYSNLDKVCEVCKTIYCDLNTNPGRQNVIDIGDYKIILDYGHNEEAYREVFTLAQRLNPSKITGIISAPGDRNDAHIKTLGKVAGEFCDEIVIKQEFDTRGRSSLEIALLLQQGAFSSRDDLEDVSLIIDECDAITYALKRAKKGEVIVIITHHLDVSVPCINRYLESRGMEPIAKDELFVH